MAKVKSHTGGTGGKSPESDLDIAALAKLARIDLSPSEKTSFARDLENILGYVSELESVQLENGDAKLISPGALKNVMREDSDPYEPGTFTADILAEAPMSEDGFIAVKPIIEK